MFRKVRIPILILALASTSAAQDYTPVDWIEVVEGGGIQATVGILSMSAAPGAGCLYLNTTINGVRYTIETAKWQVRADQDSDWEDVPGTATDGMCGNTFPENPEPGEYRWVVDMTIGDEAGKYASGNTLKVGSDTPAEDEEPEEEEEEETEDNTSSVTTRTWGEVKSGVLR